MNYTHVKRCIYRSTKPQNTNTSTLLVLLLLLRHLLLRLPSAYYYSCSCCSCYSGQLISLSMRAVEQGIFKGNFRAAEARESGGRGPGVEPR